MISPSGLPSKARQREQQCRLAGAVRTHQRQHLAALHVERSDFAARAFALAQDVQSPNLNQ